MGEGPSRLTVCLWLWRGWRPVYDFRHVNATVRMVREHLSVADDVVCFTDQPLGIECRVLPIWDDPFAVVTAGHRTVPNSFRRLRMFSPWAARHFPGWVLSIDLDAVIVRDICDLVTRDDFKINRGQMCPFNGGMWLHRTGTHTDVWNELTQDAPRIIQHKKWIGSDQGWLAHKLPGSPTWDKRDGVFHFAHTVHCENVRDLRVMFCAGRTKPWDPAFERRWPRLASEYRRHWC